MFAEKLLIVDGHNLLFQMFYGMPATIFNKDGKAIHAVMGFVGALNKIIKSIKPTHVVVLFDGEHENDRKELLAQYKANRIDYSQVPEEENPFSQLPDVYNALDYMKILHTETDDCETDDVISSYVSKYKDQMKIVISSFDSDFFQLIEDNVSVLRYRGKNSIICDSEYVLSKFNINSNVYADFKALVGDNADNIPGIKGIGPKTASLLINKYTNVEGLIENIDNIEKEKLRNVLKDNVSNLINFYKLIKLDNHAPIPFDINELEYQASEYSTMEVLAGINLK